VQFTCSNGQCTSIEGRCNGISNCDDNSDEADCPLDTSGVTIEPTSGLVATLETLTSNSLVFHDRSYTLDSLGSFGGYHFIKASNEDKHTEHSHVQTKLRLPRPLTVYVVKLTGLELPWLVSGGWQSSALTGMSYSGARPTKHTEWSEILNTDEYGPGDVYEKTFPAGVVTMPGNNGGDGSYLMVLSNPPVVTIQPVCECQVISTFHAHGRGTIWTETTMNVWMRANHGISTLDVSKLSGLGSCVVKVFGRRCWWADGHKCDDQDSAYTYSEGAHPYPLTTGDNSPELMKLECQ